MKKELEYLQPERKKKEYHKPEIETFEIFLEGGIAATSITTVSVGGPNGNSRPDIVDQPFEDKNFDFEF